MKIIGLTGGIGSGKSTVAQIAHHLGIPVYLADNQAKKLVESDVLRSKISDLLGEQAYTVEGRYNRVWVAEHVFNHPPLLAQLNALIHPEVKLDFDRWVHQQKSDCVIKEAALIQSRAGYDEIWVVFAPLAERIQRIQKRDPHRSIEQIQSIIQNQPTDQFFKNLATHCIQNGSHDILTTQILNIL